MQLVCSYYPYILLLLVYLLAVLSMLTSSTCLGVLYILVYVHFQGMSCAR